LKKFSATSTILGHIYSKNEFSILTKSCLFVIVVLKIGESTWAVGSQSFFTPKGLTISTPHGLLSQ